MIKKKAIMSLVIVLIIFGLTSTSTVGHDTAQEERNPLLLLKSVGIAIDVETEKIMRAGQFILWAVLEPQTINNLTLVPLHVLKGVVRIGPFNYNITEGRGVIAVQRHALRLFCNGTTPERENFTYRLFGRSIRTPEGSRPIPLIGFMEIENNLEYVLIFTHAHIRFWRFQETLEFPR